MSARIKVANPNRCIGCYSCMLACSRVNAKTASLIDSAIDIRTSGGIESGLEIIVCRSCIDPPCARACPTGALTPRNGGGVILDKDLCDSCMTCASACLPRAIHFDKAGMPVICTHCGVCARFCSHDVLELRKTEVL
ncbi:MAG: (Fe-S)-binding protein [ANME-2 cluster archaeon]|nr:(Fe-S)-binding protein [ANME-2 cluster archaeon]MBC2700355.1 (Fe-S)-binding protein [ANME-2 cluster archaeon]MBC2707924.1 (Fe-S)-binding protein [ANME-2 cluster archaeon]MBC2746963.1 (Fe-S)-binding protein [ANME-2 cluster archaeon]MBC2764364.1 (Fe-S)-binding protein [ANME-2 cluster archaeon]